MKGRIFCPVVTQEIASVSYLCEVLEHTRGHALRVADDDRGWLIQVVPSLLDERETPPLPCLEALHPGQARMRVDGRSGRLARALSSYGAVCHQQPLQNVVATGDLESDGRVIAVERLQDKLGRLGTGLKQAGVDGEPVLCLVPKANAADLAALRASTSLASHERVTFSEVATFDEAVELVYGLGSHPTVTEVGRLRAELERLRFVQSSWHELLDVAGRLATVAARTGHRLAAYHARLLAWATLRYPPKATVEWLGEPVEAGALRCRLDAELDQLEPDPTISSELRAERLNYQAIDTLGHDYDLRFQRGLLLADAALALSPCDGHAAEHRKILGTRAQLRTAFALRQHAYGNDVDALELAKAAVADAVRSHDLAPQDQATSENDAARVRVYAFAAADVLEALGGPSLAREHYETALLGDLGPYAVDALPDAQCVQDPTWALQKLIPSWLRRHGAHDAARRARHALAADAVHGRIRHAEKLGFLFETLATATNDVTATVFAKRWAPDATGSLRKFARWGRPPFPAGAPLCEGAGSEQVKWTSEGDAGRRQLLLWCGEALGLSNEPNCLAG